MPAGEGAALGRTLRDYELRELLARHGATSVYRAFQRSVGREVALQFTPMDATPETGSTEQLEADLQRLAQLEHPHIVSLYEYWHDADGVYLARPLLRGGTLARSLEQGPWPAPDALRLVDQIGTALGHAHHRGLVHGRLSPNSVLLDEDGNAYLSDFGLSGHAELLLIDAETLPRYTTPEQRAGTHLGAPADVFSLGVLACDVLTGAEPKDAPFTSVALPRGFMPVIQRATDPDPARRYEHVEGFLEALRQTFSSDVRPGRATGTLPDARNPFKGLRAFQESDARDFFGRDELVEELLVRASGTNLVAIVGPSGSGKSSLVKAGLIPAIRCRGHASGRTVVVAEMVPGSHPFDELEAALRPGAADARQDSSGDLGTGPDALLRAVEEMHRGTELWLVIDQFEQLFSLTAEEAVRRRFIANLVTAARDGGGQVRLVLAMRGDFFDRPLRYPELGELLRSGLAPVATPAESSMADAIAEPARRVGLGIEPGLIPTILHDVANEPGALPMMQYALTELADASRDGVLTIADYERVGGVVGALATRAEELFAALSPFGRTAARELFVRLVSVSDDGDDTARRVSRAELHSLEVDSRALEIVLETFGGFRLLSFDRDPITNNPTVEVAHEALIREWPRYRTWIDERRDDLRVERRLASAVAEWHRGDSDPSFLISGAYLDTYQQWADSTTVPLTADQRAFLDESGRQQRVRATATARRRRLVLAGVSVLAAVALVAALVAIVQRNRANDEAEAADAQAQLANDAAETADELRLEAQRDASVDQARALVARAAVFDDPDLKLLLALEAQELLEAVGAEDASVTSALYQFAYGHRIDTRVLLESEVVAVEASPDDAVFVATSMFEPSALLVDAESGDVLSARELPADAFGSAWLEDEGLVATGLVDGTIQVWSRGGELVTSIAASPFPVRPLFTANGQLVYGQFASAAPGLFRVVALDGIGGEVVLRTQQVVVDAAGSPSGSHLVVVEAGGGVRVYNTETWEDETTLALQAAVLGGVVRDAAWSATGGHIWVLGDDRLRQLDVTTGEELSSFDPNVIGASFVEVSGDGTLLAVGGPSEPVHVFEAESGELVAILEGSVGVVSAQRSLFRRGLSASWASDQRLVVSQPDGIVVWDLANPDSEAAIWPPTDLEPAVARLTSSGDVLLGTDGGGVEIFGETGALRRVIVARGEAGSPPVVSSDGSTLAVPAGDAVEIVDLTASDDAPADLVVGPAGLTRPLALSRDGRILVAGTSREPGDGRFTVAIIDTETGEQRHRLGSRLDGARGVFTSDDVLALLPISRVANETALPSSGLWLIDVATGELIGRGPPQNCITAVAISSDDRLAATVGCDGNVSLYDVAALAGDEPWKARLGGNADVGTAGAGVTFEPGDDIIIVTRANGRVEAFEADERFARAWAFDIGDHAGAPIVRDGRVWVGATRGAGADLSGGVIAMPLAVDRLVAFASSLVTRGLSDDECREYLERPTCAMP